MNTCSDTILAQRYEFKLIPLIKFALTSIKIYCKIDWSQSRLLEMKQDLISPTETLKNLTKTVKALCDAKVKA
jgi:hypothetical protein